MKDSIKKRKCDSRGKSSLSDSAKEALCLPEHCNPKDIIIETSDDGDLGFKEFYVIHCQKCHVPDTGYMKYFINQYMDFLPAGPKITNNMDNWDKIVAKHLSVMKYMDVVGCILLHEPTLNACPNERKYITRPVEHADSKCHKWTCVSPTIPVTITTTSSDIQILDEASSSSGKCISSLTSPTSTKSSSSGKCTSLTSPTSTKKQNLLTVAVDGTVTSEKTVKVKNMKKLSKEITTITVKHQKQLVFKPINSMLDPKVSLNKNPTSQLEKDAQNACNSFVLSGCSKEVSSNTTIEFYEKHVFHLRKHHQENVGHLQFDTKVLP